MMKWIDSEVTAKTYNPIILNVLSVMTAYIMIFLSLMLLFSSSYHLSFQDKLLVIIFICGLVFWVYGGFFSLIEERRFVRNIFIDREAIYIENAFHQIKKIKSEDVKYISNEEEKWVLPKPHYWKDDKKGLTIKLKNGKFFRISPHMERIDELQFELEKIVEENNE